MPARESLGNQYPYFTAFHDPSLCLRSPALPRSVKYFPREGEASFVSTCRGRWVFAGLLLTASFPWSSAGAAGAPSRPYGSELCWAFVAGVSLSLLHLTVRREKQSQFICHSAAPFLWAMGFFVLVSLL